MKTIDQFNFAGEKALIRVDFNVPLNNNFEITDDTRIAAAIPTIKKILNDGGSVILMSHLGRPKNGPEEKFSLSHIVKHTEKLSGAATYFAEDCIGDAAIKRAKDLQPGEILILENLRFYKEEEKGDENFAEKLSKLGTFYVNDAFGTAHRAHASTAVVAKFFPNKKCFGYIMSSEIANAQKVLDQPKRPFTAIVGGAKVSDKLLIIENLMNIADNILIGGGMAYTFFKAMGGEIGNSLCENDRIELTKEILNKARQKGVSVFLPSDSIIADKFATDANTRLAASNSIPNGWMGLDIGEDARKEYSEVLSQSKTILWNGPMGVFEMPAFSGGTKTVAEAVAIATDNGAFSLIGGGDSAAAVNQFGYNQKVSYVSTGGGALLEYFEGKELPGISAINNQSINA